MTIIHKTLLDILESQSFDRLEPFKEAAVWNNFAKEDRVLLAKLLVMQGSQQLAKGNHQVLDNFEIACQISSNAPDILYQQGSILSSYSENIRCLTLASQAFGRALQQNPSSCKGWYQRARVLTAIGIFEGEASYYVEADQNFEKARGLLKVLEESINQEEFYWEWAKCLASLGKVSGEPLDFYQAIDKFRLAYQLGCRRADFLNDYGNSFADLGHLLEKSEYFIEALKLFNGAVQEDSEHAQAWYHQACCLQRLVDFSPNDKLWEQADRSFAKAATLHSDSSELWLKWGRLEMSIGKIKHDTQKLEASLTKFSKANELESHNPKILSSWAEVELFLGFQEERLDLIHSARSKILTCLGIQPEDPEVWYLYGSCLNELGRYFNDEDYYNQAIEKFQYGLSLSRQNPLLWYGIALAHYALGEITQQQGFFEKSVRYCAKVIECGGSGFAQFWNDWGVALVKLGDMKEDVSYVEQAIEKFELALKQPLQNVDGEDVDLEWVYNYGCAFDLLGDLKEDPTYFEKAVQILTQVLQLDPHYIQARYNLALSLSHLGEALCDVEVYLSAVEHFQLLINHDAEDQVIHLDYGVTLTNLALLVHDVHQPARSMSFYRQAETHLLQAASLGNTQSYYQLAGLYSITGHFDYAMYYLERAQSFDVLPGIEDLMHDEWLEGVRYIPAFRQFIHDLSSRQSMDDKS